MMTTFDVLLNNNPDEPTTQTYFEKHPQALLRDNHILGNALIRKLPLGRDHITDLAFIQPQSGRTFLFLIELESPTKLIFKGNDEFTPEFNHGFQQVRDWLYYAERNHEAIRDMLEPLRAPTNANILRYTARGMLFFGRSAELNNVRRKERWDAIGTENPLIELRTYDGVAQTYKHFFDDGNPLGFKCLRYMGRDFDPV